MSYDVSASLSDLFHSVWQSLCLVAQSCLTLCDLVDCSLQAPLSMGILQARILEWVAMPSSRGSSQPRNRTQVSHITGGFFTFWATREANLYSHVHCCKWHYFFLFNGCVVFHFICISHLLCPFLWQWTFRLLPCPGYCKQWSSKHWGTCIRLDHVFLCICA